MIKPFVDGSRDRVEAAVLVGIRVISASEDEDRILGRQLVDDLLRAIGKTIEAPDQTRVGNEGKRKISRLSCWRGGLRSKYLFRVIGAGVARNPVFIFRIGFQSC